METSEAFKEGYEYFIKHNEAYLGAEPARIINQLYLNDIEEKINILERSIKSFQGNGNPNLHGYLAEVWHANTFNIDAAVKRTKECANTLNSNKLGSVDVSTSWGEEYSLKYYAKGGASAFKQAVSLEDKYRMFIRGKEFYPTREEYLISKGYNSNTDMSQSLYWGQSRLIPSDQIEHGYAELKRKIAHDSCVSDRQQWVRRYQETSEKLTDRIESPDGAQSRHLTQVGSKNLQAQAYKGEFDLKEYDINLKKVSDKSYLYKNAFKSGMNAAWISALLKAVPQIIEAVKKAVKDGYVSEGDIVQIGKDVKSGAVDGFLKGLFCGVLTTSAETGYLGGLMQSARGSQSFTPCIAAAVVLVIQAVGDGVQMAKGIMTRGEFCSKLEKNIYMTVGSISLGSALQYIVHIPILSYMMGSIIGAVLGGLFFEAKEFFLISLCVENGYTFFGLVEQDYEFPVDIRKKLGYDTFEYKAINDKEFRYESFDNEEFSYESFNYEKLDIVMLKRGLVGVRKIGYQ